MMARGMGQSVSKTAAHCVCFQSAVVCICGYQKWYKKETVVIQEHSHGDQTAKKVYTGSDRKM